jgi:hypothetical protein
MITAGAGKLSVADGLLSTIFYTIVPFTRRIGYEKRIGLGFIFGKSGTKHQFGTEVAKAAA